MPRLWTRILHVSDLHFGRSIDPQLRDQLVARCRQLEPHFIVVSGDLVDHPFPWLMARARRYLDELAAAARGATLVVVPGNHDYKLFGNVGLRSLSRVPYQVYFQEGGRDLTWQRRLGLYIRLAARALLGRRPDAGRPSDRPVWSDEHPGRGVVFVGFDSNPLFEAFATGKVSEAQISTFTSAVEEEPRAGRWKRGLRVAVVHHHPLPIPDLSTSGTARIADSLMVFYNAGTFLRQLGSVGVDLVLHGHKHFSGAMRVLFEVPDGDQHAMTVLAAGSATHRAPDERSGNQFWVIDLLDDETVDVHRWYHRSGVDQAPSISRRWTLSGIERVRAARMRRARTALGYSARRWQRHVRVTTDGYSEVTEKLEGVRVHRAAGLRQLPVELEVQRPQYLRHLEQVEGPDFSQLKLAEGCTAWRLRATLDLGSERTPASEPFAVGYRYLLLNGHAVNGEEFRRRASRLDWEYASIECTGAVEALRLSVSLPPESADDVFDYGAECLYQPRSLDVTDTRAQEDHPAETQRLQGTVEFDGNTLELLVDDPVPGFIYRVRWSYRRPDPEPGTNLEARVKARAIVAELLAEAPGEEGGKGAVAEASRQALEELRAEVERWLPARRSDERLDLGLFVFDEEARALRLVATTDGEMGGEGSELYPGEGCAGFAFEKRRVVLYHRSRDRFGYYLGPEELGRQAGTPGAGARPWDALMPHQFLVTVPCVHEGELIGVVSIGSGATYSRLLPIFDGSEAAQSEAAGYLSALVRLWAKELEWAALGG